MCTLANLPYQKNQSPRISVVIPTRDRSADALLRSIARQETGDGAANKFEILFIDDGSRPDHAQALARHASHGDWPFPLAIRLQENTGPATARNRVVQDIARGQIVLFLNDDVTLEPGHFAAHIRLHALHPEPHIVARGLTDWPPVRRDSSLMRYLRSRLFVYDLELPADAEHYVYFHTCDLSLKRSLLLEHPFDEDFPTAAFEDTELGYRLYKHAGMRLVLLPEARSHHHHDYTARDLWRRARLNGRGAAILIEKQPDLRHDMMDRYYDISRRRRLLRAARHLLARRVDRFWEETERVVYLRSLDRALRERSASCRSND